MTKHKHDFPQKASHLSRLFVTDHNITETLRTINHSALILRL